MTLNRSTLNSDVINNTDSGVVATGVGQILSFEQTVKVLATGSIIQLEQTVELLITAEGSIVQFEQTIQTKASGAIISIEQTVQAAGVNTFYSRNGWYPTITLGGVVVPNEELRGRWTYSHSESNSALFDFSLLPTLGVQDIFAYQGKSVTCDVQTSSGVHRIFTGVVDIPEIDVLNEYITLRCTDNRDERLNSGVVNPASIGSYSTTVFGDIVDNKQQLTDRLTTVTASLDWDGYGNPYYTSWTPKGTADFTLTDNTVYRQEPSIRIESRAQIINQVDIQFKYSYQRLHHGTIIYLWTNGYVGNAARFLTEGPSLVRRDTIMAAANSAGWPVVPSSVAYTPILAQGIYNISGSPVIWSTTENLGVNVPATNPDGSVKVDSNGNTIYKFVPSSSTDMTKVYCFGAQWIASQRWSQNIEENYTLSVTAPQSTSRYGVVSQKEVVSFTDVDNSAQWENYPAYTPPPAGITSEPFYINNTLTLSEYNNATLTLINRAKARIVNSHRDSRVTFQRNIWPQIDLRHTVELSTTRIDCKGKVVGITHTLDVGTGEAYSAIDLAMFRTTGSQTESAFNPPTRPNDSSFPAYAGGVNLQSHYGQDPDGPGAENWTGHIGNRWIYDRTNGYIDYRRTNYQESFVVDTPDIPDAYRNTRSLARSQTYNVAIPANNLTWTTVGK